MLEPKFNFAFLLHVSRSGSTYLGRLLAENCIDLAVIAETNYFRILIAHQKVYKQYQPIKLANLVLEDPKFKAFQFSDEEILNAFLECKDHKEAIYYITEMILEKLNIIDVKHVLIKDGSIIDFIPEIQRQFSNIKIIHIKRDPRACINSLLHTPKAFLKGRTSMGWDDIEFCANQYQWYMSKAQKLEAAKLDLLTVNYEDLVVQQDQEVNRVLGFLDLKSTAADKSRTQNYLRKQEHRIHRNIYRGAQKERLDSWKSELKKWEILFIESKLKNLISQPSLESNNLSLISARLMAKKNHGIGIFNLSIYRIRRYLLKGNLNMFFLKLRLRFDK